MTLRAAGAVPPILLPGLTMGNIEVISTPVSLPRAAVPSAVRPMKFPSILLACASTSLTPAPLSPEKTLQAPVQRPPGVIPIVPPIVLLLALISTPVPLPIGSVPLALVPMKLPWDGCLVWAAAAKANADRIARDHVAGPDRRPPDRVAGRLMGDARNPVVERSRA
jgi:hypothetical protein